MANGIVCAHKLGKQNMHQYGITNNTLNATSPNSHSHDMSNENSDIFGN